MLMRPEFTRPRPKLMRWRPEASSSQIHEAEAEASTHEAKAKALPHEARNEAFLAVFCDFFCILLQDFCKPHWSRKLRSVYCLMVIGDN